MKTVGQGSNPWGRTNFYIMSIIRLKELMKFSLELIQHIVELAETNNLTNKQYFIDWEDKLNKYSVKDHNNEHIIKDNPKVDLGK